MAINSHPIWRQPKLLALVIAVVIGLWVLSGVIIPSERNEAVEESEVTKLNNSLKIKVEVLDAKEKAREITLNGVSMPERITLVEAETEGKVEAILHEEGQIVEKGSVLMRLDKRDRQNKINEARALLKQRQVEYNAAKKLHAKGFSTKVRLTQAEAAVASARTLLKQAQLDMSFTTIHAPYSGLIEEVLVEEGDLVGRGFNTQTVMRFVDLNPLKVTGQISELERAKVEKGDIATIRFSSGESAKGIVGFVASVADNETRTFRIEVEVPNEKRTIQAGISAEIALQADTQMSIEVPSSVLSLDDTGKVGVKLVDDTNTVRFTPVKVLAQSAKGVWIVGLPDRVRMVTEGVSFIADGQKIEAEMLAENDNEKSIVKK